MKRGKNKQKLKIKPMIYTMMEIRKMEFLKRKGLPIPTELLNRQKQAEEEKKLREANIHNAMEYKTPLPKINEEDERAYGKKEDSKLDIKPNEIKPKGNPEQEKVSLIQIGVPPKLNTDSPAVNGGTEINKDATQIQVEKAK